MLQELQTTRSIITDSPVTAVTGVTAITGVTDQLQASYSVTVLQRYSSYSGHNNLSMQYWAAGSVFWSVPTKKSGGCGVDSHRSRTNFIAFG